MIHVCKSLLLFEAQGKKKKKQKKNDFPKNVESTVTVVKTEDRVVHVCNHHEKIPI